MYENHEAVSPLQFSFNSLKIYDYYFVSIGTQRLMKTNC